MLDDHKESCLVTLTGRPGSGKTTIAKRIISAGNGFRPFPGRSVTTRLKRNGDLEGEYEHVSEHEFAEMQMKGLLLWDVHLPPYRYGTRTKSVEDVLAEEGTFLMTLAPEVLPKLIGFAGSERVFSFFIESSGNAELARRMVKLRKDEPFDACRRLRETEHWTIQELSGLNIPFIPVQNPDEEVPGKAAAEFVLHVLHGFGQ